MTIRRAITNNALVFIACFSSQSAARTTSYQNEELVLAVEQLRQRRPDVPWLIPVRFDDCPFPDLDLGGGRTLASIQRADLFGDRYEEQMTRLVATVQRLLGEAVVTRAGAEHTPQQISRRDRAQQIEHEGLPLAGQVTDRAVLGIHPAIPLPQAPTLRCRATYRSTFRATSTPTCAPG